ncbi:hypothetical protein [Inquilinus sp. CA228]|uniref:hypothetical protein n=1 Tax=Inquilinus sp. CA228 TaxID=3455609 RepID=UPI003F8D104B
MHSDAPKVILVERVSFPLKSAKFARSISWERQGMRFQTCRKLLPVAVLSAILVGCADLSAIREFADSSIATAQYTGLVEDYVNEPLREERYQPVRYHPTLEAMATARKQEEAALLARLAIVESYMKALGNLSADETPSFDAELDALQGKIVKAKFVDEAEASSAAVVVKLVLRAAADGWRQAELKEFIEEGNEPFQTIVNGLRDIVSDGFSIASLNERQAAETYYGTLQKSTADPAAKAAVGEWGVYRVAEIDARAASIKSYAAVLERISDGHQKLYDHRDDFPNPDLLRQMKEYSEYIKSIIKKLNIDVGVG